MHKQIILFKKKVRILESYQMIFQRHLFTWFFIHSHFPHLVLRKLKDAQQNQFFRQLPWVGKFKPISQNSSLDKGHSNGSLPRCCENSAVTLAAITLLHGTETKFLQLGKISASNNSVF